MDGSAYSLQADRLRAIALERAELLQERDELIAAARAAGMPVTHIAEAADLSAMQTHRIINASKG